MQTSWTARLAILLLGVQVATASFRFAEGSKHLRTNAERLAHGLPPLPPTFKRTLPGSADAPTRALQARYGAPSPTTPMPLTYSGRLEVRSLDGERVGFVTSSNNGASFGVDTKVDGNTYGESSDLHVKFETSSNTFDVQITSPSLGEASLLGAATSVGPTSISGGSPNFVSLTNVGQTPAGSIPTSSAGKQCLVESAIWSFDEAGQKLTAQFVNPDGSRPATVLAYDVDSNSLIFTGDLASYEADKASKVDPEIIVIPWNSPRLFPVTLHVAAAYNDQWPVMKPDPSL
ncbi:hypothetical protein HGRIS_005019 [Hohenbuehelia grisea]|uniref:Uncharacterized protein n=1 Tax=Hohenbuehelia grisea TaxID=104357 RepID=A0ABR3JE65_9AGAR